MLLQVPRRCDALWSLSQCGAVLALAGEKQAVFIHRRHAAAEESFATHLAPPCRPTSPVRAWTASP